MKRFAGLLVIGASAVSFAFQAPPIRVLLLRGADVIVTDENGQSPVVLGGDVRPKSMLRWLPGNHQFSYLVRDPDGAKARLVVCDLAGRPVKELAIRPPRPSFGGFRFVEELTWRSTTTVRVGGSLNPYNCERVDIDVDTGTESNWQYGACGTLVTSPDGRHFAELGLGGPTPEGSKTDTVEIDCKGLRCESGAAYRGGETPFRVLAGPSWLADSSRVAVIEQRVRTREVAVTFLSVTGATRRVPVPSVIADHPELVVVGTKVVVGEGSNRVLADPAGGTFAPLDFGVSEQLEKARIAGERRKIVEQRATELKRRLGAGEAVAEN